ncbi:MAG: hypothetical protein U0176_26560 [Bacteroidia bacterium]
MKKLLQLLEVRMAAALGFGLRFKDLALEQVAAQCIEVPAQVRGGVRQFGGFVLGCLERNLRGFVGLGVVGLAFAIQVQRLQCPRAF